MPLSDYPEVQKLINGDYEFRFGDYISKGFEIFKQHVGEFVGFFLIYLILVNGIIPLIPGGNLIVLVVGPPMVAGLYIVANKISNGKSFEFKDFFNGFKFLKHIFLRNLISLFIIAISIIPFVFFIKESGLFEWLIKFSTDPEFVNYAFEEYPGFPVSSLFLLIPALYFIIAYLWADMFIVFKGMNFWDAMEASRRLISNKWFLFFGFAIFFILLVVGGLLALIIGVLFTYPLALCISYAAFEDIVGLNEVSEKTDDLLDHLVDG